MREAFIAVPPNIIKNPRQLPEHSWFRQLLYVRPKLQLGNLCRLGNADKRENAPHNFEQGRQ